ncbi:MAG: tRNA pseudouridine(55) synthase TruB [Chloroflexi bacterium]|nr:tRNA pseudouridine(55) synthase TruB [Chloroflexota bacterium]MBM4453610.1 tRNA pseudouridine(55) synthase TruB [Chloroflexota bacterium]
MASINGILNINKPEGITSFKVVSWLKRLTGEKRIGHAGTLDPLATGVLPCCLGQATRIIQFITDASKAYLAQIKLGIATDTFDREGHITHHGDISSITTARIEEALVEFQGLIEQRPPAYSALKHNGKRYYELARAGLPATPRPRRVEISKIELVSYQTAFATVKIECSKGTYIRSLAHDLGLKLGCYAHLENLSRLRCGTFCIEDALTPEQIEDAANQGALEGLLLPTDSPLLDLPAVIVDKKKESAIANGQCISLDTKHLNANQYCRVYSLDGNFIAMLHFASATRRWHPKRVFIVPDDSNSREPEGLTANI